MRRAVAIGAGAVALAGAVWFLRGGGKAPHAEPRWVRVERGDLVLYLETDGFVRPFYQVELKSKASGQIVRFDKEPGDFVEEGEVLVELDPTTEERNVARAQAEYDRAQAALVLTRAEMDRQRARAQSEAAAAAQEVETRRRDLERLERLPQGQVSVAERDAARLAAREAEERQRRAEAERAYWEATSASQIADAEARVRLARLALEDAQERLRDTSVRAPIRGVLLQKFVEKGQIVASGINAVSGGTPIAVLGDLSRLIVETRVDEMDIGKVAVGQPALVDVQDGSGRSYEARVVHIAPKAETENQIPRIPVKVEILAAPEMERRRVDVHARVRFLLERREGVLRIPSSAARYEAGRAMVWTRSGPRPVRTGADSGEWIEITEGLSEGEEVATDWPATTGRPSWR
jgi:multidrug efflux pump subunit AcrA (membrane-fusion protein)